MTIVYDENNFAEASPSMLVCNMTDECKEPVTHLDKKGFVYCKEHGLERRNSQPCRKLKPYELNKLQRGEALSKY